MSGLLALRLRCLWLLLPAASLHASGEVSGRCCCVESGGEGSCSSLRFEMFLCNINRVCISQQLENSLNEFGEPWKLDPGDGAFYGPKVRKVLFINRFR